MYDYDYDYDYDSCARRIAATNHYLQRCRQRDIPEDAHRVVPHYGSRAALDDGRIAYHLSRDAVHRLAREGGVELSYDYDMTARRPVWDYADVTVIVSRDGVALTTYRAGSAPAR